MKWTQSDIDYLNKSYPVGINIDIIVSHLNKSRRSIFHKVARLGLSRSRVALNRSKDLFYRKKYDQTYYLNNKNEIYKRKVVRLRKHKSELITLLGGKCSSCGYNKCPAALDFHHHSTDKESEVTIVIKNYSKEKALKEAAKCILLCANCHRELHYKDP